MKRYPILVLTGALCIAAVVLTGCSRVTPTVPTQHLNRMQAESLPPSQWGPIANPVTGIRVDGTNENGQQLYFFIGIEADTVGFWTSQAAAGVAANSYWTPR